MQFLVKPLFWSLIFCFSSCFLLEASAQTTLNLVITFDNYPEETSWEIKSGTTIVNSGGPYGSQNDGSTLEIPISINAGSYTFIMKDSHGDGLCCSYGNGTYTLYGPQSVILATGSTFTTSQTTPFTISSGCSSNTLPTVTLSATPTTITGSGTVSLSATASDIDGTISKVEFLRNNVLIGTDLTSPYSFSYSETTVGTYSYTAKAYDNCPTPGVGISSPISVTVNSATCNAPVVSITQPANNTTVTAGTNVQISANVTNSSGTLSNVKFYVDNVLKLTLTQAPFTYTENSIAAGSRVLRVDATNSCGSTGTATVNITASSGGSTCNGWSNNCATTGSLYRLGQVGIGTSNYGTDATYLLFVKGGLKAEKMQLELSTAGGWADYVFAPDYKLMPLKQVAEYLKNYRHLPGMASEAEMRAEGGINVGKIAAQQQAKIEELFLYMIDMNKKMEILQGQIDQLQKENQLLRKQQASSKKDSK